MKKEIIESLSLEKVSNGVYNASIEVNGEIYSSKIDDMHLIDVVTDECYDDNDNCDSFYESRGEAIESLVDKIMFYNCLP